MKQCFWNVEYGYQQGDEFIHTIDGTTCLMEIEQLIRKYAQMLGRDLSLQELEEELRDLLRKYNETERRLLATVADDGCVSGYVAYHHLSKECYEIKRLYVGPFYQGQGVGQKLVETLLLLTKDDGHSCMVLGTIEPLQSAIRLCKGFGFQETEPYYDNPMEDVIYVKKLLK